MSDIIDNRVNPNGNLGPEFETGNVQVVRGVSACVGCNWNVGTNMRPECSEPTASELIGCFSFVEACAWRSEKKAEVR